MYADEQFILALMKFFSLAILSLISLPALGWVPLRSNKLVNRNTLAFNNKATNIGAASCSFEDALKIGADVCQSLQSGNSESAAETLGALLSHGNGIRYDGNTKAVAVFSRH